MKKLKDINGFPVRCQACEKDLTEGQDVWLEYDQRVGAYTDQDIDPEDSQGAFPFGKTCAKIEKAKWGFEMRLLISGSRPEPVNLDWNK